MRLVRLAIDRLPGIAQGFVFEGLDPGVNLVLGPNACGKSSLVRALRYLVVPPSAQDPPDLVLAATLEGSGGRWQVTRTGRGVIWRRDGAPSAAPELPEATFLHCYWLSLEDLLGEDRDHDGALFERLRRELTGGFDLAAVRDAEPFHLGLRHGKNEERALREARSKLREVQRRHETLREGEQRLPRLDQALADAQRADAQARLAERASELLRIRRVRSSEASSPQDAVEPNDPLSRRLHEIAATREAHRRERDQARTSLAETGLESGMPSPGALSACRRNLEGLETLRSEREVTARRLEAARRAHRQAADALGAGPGSPSPRLAADVVGEAEEVARRVHEGEKEIAELRARLGPPEAVAGSLEELERSSRAAAELRRWLRAGASRRPWAKALLAAIGAVGMGVAYLLDAPSETVAAIGAGALALLALVLAFATPRARAEARRRYADTGLPGPASWTLAAVEGRLETLEDEVAKLRARRGDAERRTAIESAVEEAESRLEASRARLRSLGQRAGFEPRATLDFYRFVMQARDLDRAALEVTDAEAETDRLGREMQPLAEAVALFLLEWGERAAGDGGEPGPLRQALDRLEIRAREAQEARGNIAQADRELEHLEEELSRMEEERATELQESPALRALVAAGDAAGIEAHRRDLEEEAERAEALREERTEIRVALDQVRRGHALEEALAAWDDARTALVACRERALHAAAGLFLLDEIGREHRTESQPELLREAGERFARFTRDAFSLELDPAGAVVARDRAQGETRSIAELSVGTRMQLFLALRMAWARAVEGRHEPLPIFLDEALTTSDPERFAEVARALESVAADEGRQILYLSAQPTDRLLWERGTGKAPHVVDLLELRRQGSSLPDFDDELRLPDRPALPEPAPGEAPEGYAVRLGVSPIDPGADAGLIHPFHLLRDDLPTLHHLMAVWGIVSLGQLEGLLESRGGKSALGEERGGPLRHRIALARRWLEALCIGRGRPVDRSALERSGAVSASFLEAVSELAAEAEGDAARLLEGLRAGRVPRFFTAKMDELEAWLESEGFLDRRAPLDAAGRRREALLAAGLPSPDPSLAQVVDWLEAGCPLAGGSTTRVEGTREPEPPLDSQPPLPS